MSDYEVLAVPMPPEEKEKLKKASKKLGFTMAALARYIITQSEFMKEEN